MKIFSTLKTYFIAHKFIGSIVVIILIGLGYWGYKTYTAPNAAPRYVTAKVAKGTLIVSITGSGQTSASNQLDLKPKASGDVTFVGVQAGQEVKAGTLLVQLNAQDALKTVRDAAINLESAKISLQKLQQPADALSLTQAQNTLAKAQENKQNAQDSLAKAYEDGFNTVANAFLDLPTVISGLQDILFTNNLALGGTSQFNVDYYTTIAVQYDQQALQNKTDTYAKYQTARLNYDKTFADYKTVTRYSDEQSIVAIIDQTYETTKSLAEAVKSANNLIQFYKDKLIERNLKPAAFADTHLASLNTYTGKTNTHLLNLLAAKNTIKTDKDAIVNADRAISENTQSLAKLQAGADPLDIASSQISVKQRESALSDAREQLANYYVRAPFDGTVATVSVKKGDSINSGTAVVTLVTKQKVAELSLNEVDAAKIKVGQKATLTFDAIEGLSLAGEVSQIDTLGTVSQGVVTYNVKITFDTQDERVKSGMSVSAAIVTDLKQDVLLVPSSAVKAQGDISYVEMFTPPLPDQSSTNQGYATAALPVNQTVEVGLSNDTQTEILSGLKVGDQIVTRTITATTAQTTPAPSLFGGAAGRTTGGGGGAAILRGVGGR